MIAGTTLPDSGPLNVQAAPIVTAEDVIALGMRERGLTVMTDAYMTDGASIGYHYAEGFAAPELQPVQGPFAIEPDEWRAWWERDNELEAAMRGAEFTPGAVPVTAAVAQAAGAAKGAGWLSALGLVLLMVT